MSYLRGDRPAGFDIELINRIIDRGNLDSEIIAGRWTDIIDGLSSGTIDAVSGIIYTEKRAEIFDFSIPYLSESYAVYTQGGSGISTLSDLKGRKLAVLKGDAIIETYIIPQGLEGRMVLTPSFYTALQLVADGDADYTIAPYTMGQNAVDVLDLEEFNPAGRSLLTVEYRFAVKKGRSNLLFTLNEGLVSLNETESIDEIYSETAFTKQFAKSSTSERASGVHLLILMSVVLFIGMMILMIFRNRIQKKISGLESDSVFFKMILDNIPIQLSWKNNDGLVQGVSRMWEAAPVPSDIVGLREAAVMASGKASIEYIDSERRLTTLPLLREGTDIAGVLNLLEDCGEQMRSTESLRSLSARLAVKEAELEQFRITDQLTGLFNRTYIAEKLQDEIDLYSSHRQKFSVMLIEVETKPDLSSDQNNKVKSDIIKKAADSIRKLLRRSDIAGFIGCGQFLVIMPKTCLVEAEKAIGNFTDSISIDGVDSSIGWCSFEFPLSGSGTLHPEVSELLNLRQGTK